MAAYIRNGGIYILILLIVLIPPFFPRISSALRALNADDLKNNSPSLVEKQEIEEPGSHLLPLDEKLLDDLSPSLVAPVGRKISSQEYRRQQRMEFEKSVCFKRCHQPNDIYASDHTEKQWRLIIEQDGHAIFSEIFWESPEQKAAVLNFLLKYTKNAKIESAGIGVW